MKKAELLKMLVDIKNGEGDIDALITQTSKTRTTLWNGLAEVVEDDNGISIACKDDNFVYASINGQVKRLPFVAEDGKVLRMYYHTEKVKA